MLTSKASHPPARISLVDDAYKELKRLILSNEFSPNFQATESELALRLNMSRTPVHEALIRLEKEQLVENIPRRGMRVLPVSATDMLEIYQVLTALESQAVELLASKPVKERGVAVLEKILDKMDAALEKDEPIEWAAADERFHRALFELTGNGRLASAGLAFREQVDRARLWTLPLRQGPGMSNKAHRELVGLIAQGKAEEAFNTHRSHRTRVTAELTEIIARFGWVGR